MRRRFGLVPALAAVACLLAGCFGPVQTRSVGVTFDCTWSAMVPDPPPPPPETAERLHLRLDSPRWTNPGETVPLRDLTVAGYDLPDPLPNVGTSFILLLDLHGATWNGISVNGHAAIGGPAPTGPERTLMPNGSGTATITAAPGETVTATINSLLVVDFFGGDLAVGWTCLPGPSPRPLVKMSVRASDPSPLDPTG